MKICNVKPTLVGNNMRSFVISGDRAGEGSGLTKPYSCKAGLFEKYTESLAGHVSSLNVPVALDSTVLENMEQCSFVQSYC